MKYEIQPLQWDGDQLNEEYDCVTAHTAFGDYYIRKTEDGFSWDYCFDEYYDEGQESCKSEQDGKEKAFIHWCGRLTQCLNKV